MIFSSERRERNTDPPCVNAKILRDNNSLWVWKNDPMMTKTMLESFTRVIAERNSILNYTNTKIVSGLL